MIEKFYNTDTAAEVLNVTRRTIYNYIVTEQLPATKVGKRFLIRESDLNDFINRGTEPRYMDKLRYRNKDNASDEGTEEE